MSVTDIRKDPDSRTMTVGAEFDHPVEQVWQLWADPRKLERWCGPPEYRRRSTAMNSFQAGP